MMINQFADLQLDLEQILILLHKMTLFPEFGVRADLSRKKMFLNVFPCFVNP